MNDIIRQVKVNWVHERNLIRLYSLDVLHYFNVYRVVLSEVKKRTSFQTFTTWKHKKKNLEKRIPHNIYSFLVVELYRIFLLNFISAHCGFHGQNLRSFNTALTRENEKFLNFPMRLFTYKLYPKIAKLLKLFFLFELLLTIRYSGTSW